MTTRVLTGKAAVERLKEIIHERNAELRGLRAAALAVVKAKTSAQRSRAIGFLDAVIAGQACGFPFDGVQCDRPKGHEAPCSWTRR